MGGPVETPSWEEVLRIALRRAGVADEDEYVMAVLHKVAKDVAMGIMLAERERMEREYDERRKALNDLVKVIKPLLGLLELGPFDRIISVAIRETDGNVRVVNV